LRRKSKKKRRETKKKKKKPRNNTHICFFHTVETIQETEFPQNYGIKMNTSDLLRVAGGPEETDKETGLHRVD
jgi:ribosomal 30S subunit maturation factor RimM